ncbi:tigger transposable element-derived protein 1-like [Erythrolamprus reginae]|uniref:tigger transposable element-derived protein 1-like n=1 Tax=Erythrolamprus reginae TaxID=121349 RepID=UPI00396CFBAF
MIAIAEKIQLLDMLKGGRSCTAMGCHFGVNESTVGSIKKSALAVWINDYQKKGISQTKARSLYESLVGGEPEEIDDNKEEEDDVPQPGTSSESQSSRKKSFTASKGWFAKFQEHYGLKNVSLYGEASSADKEAAEAYMNEKFKKIISDGDYKSEQVFNMDKTGLFWKRMPSRTFLFKEEAKASGFKAFKDCVTLVMCGNAAGYLLKPALIYRSRNPRALKNKNKNLLPVHWMYNSKAWIMKMLTSDWFHQCFVPQVKVYLLEKGLPFKVLLLMDNAGGHATDLQYDGVQIEFLLPNTTWLIQPMDQGVIRAFKALNTRNAMDNIVAYVDAAQENKEKEEENFKVKTYWWQYTIAICLQNIQKASKDMKLANINASWKKMWPDIIYDDKGFTPAKIQHSTIQKAVQLATYIGGDGFSDMKTQDLDELLDCHFQPLTDVELKELTSQAARKKKKSSKRPKLSSNPA